MAYDTFKIKFLFELFPDTDFEDELLCTQTVQKLPGPADVISTTELLGDVRSNAKIPRMIQSNVYEYYEVKLIFSRNIDFNILSYTPYTTLTTTESETFLIYDVNIEQTKISGGLNYSVLISFKKEADQLIYHSASDNVLSYKTATSEAVNEIQFDVNNPSYSFNNVNVVSTALGSYFAYFYIPLTDLTDTITVGDKYYLHTDNTTFNALTDTGGDYLSFAYCTAKSATTLSFNCSNTPTGAPTPLDIDVSNMYIDHVSDGRGLPSGVTVADKTISFKIYTFIEPNFSHESNIEDGNKYDDGREENQYTIERDIASFKIWLKEDEKYLAEYLNYALAENIEISLKNYDNILPSQSKEIITINTRDRLIDLFEYDIKIIYNVKRVDLTE